MPHSPTAMVSETDIVVTQKGKYRLFFNDITGFYYFMKQPKK